ncbi:FAD-dependent oxidoreductase [Dankookia sp. P2]|uniref:FAD-dependent oxidoreductase n=1 Tax=Dankookia sp. P2 TaxID=3423955 RepID=UPI003D67EC5C
MTRPRIAVIGAGLAGLSCARALLARGATIRLFDKGRGAGGRLATRRAEAGGQPLHPTTARST